ncbi:MAG: hypothetical protein ACOX81_06100 [Candidatus Heteroscillospira sp.]
MGELEERLNGLLNNPDELSRLADMAKNLMGGGLFSGGGEAEKTDDESFNAMEPMMGKLLSKLTGSGGGQSANTRLLLNLCPCLEEKRAEKLRRAIRMAQMAQVARTVLKDYGGDGDGNK